MSTPSSALPPAPPAPPASDTPGSKLDAVLRILTAAGRVTSKMKHSAQAALSSVPADESVIGAYRCGIRSGVTEGEGVAVLTSGRLSVFDRRGFRSADQRFQFSVTSPFSIEAGPEATCLTLAAAGARSATLDLFDADRAEALREQLEVLRAALEEGWWSQASVAWPGWLGSGPAWSYLGGDPHLRMPALGLRLQLARPGISLGDADGSTVHVAPWSAVNFLHVVGLEEGLQRAAARGLLTSERFAAAWRSLEWSAFLVVGYGTGEHIFFGCTSLTESDLRTRLFRLAEATPFVHRDDEESPWPAPAPPATVESSTAAEGPSSVETPDAPQPGPTGSPGTPTGSPAPSFDLAAQLERLAALHQQGVLDDSEFVRAKTALLG